MNEINEKNTTDISSSDEKNINIDTDSDKQSRPLIYDEILGLCESELETDKSDSDTDQNMKTATGLYNNLGMQHGEQKVPPKPQEARLLYSAYADMKPSEDSRYAMLGVFVYVPLLILFSIPAAGLIAAILFAVLAQKYACKNLALAAVAVHIIIALLITVALLLLQFVFHIDVISMAADVFDTLINTITAHFPGRIS